MLATIVLDAYKENETMEVANALEQLVNAEITSSWSSAGIYCYWNYYTREILYFGLARDLYDRFKQHNGLTTVNRGTSKYAEIKEYFANNQKLGFSIILQSSLSQPFTRKIKKKYRDVWELNEKQIEELGSDGLDAIQLMEGRLINSFKKSNGQFPQWNKIGGSLIGQIRTTDNDWKLAQLFTKQTHDVYIAKATIRELISNPTFNVYENYLHSLRISPLPWHKAIEFNDKMGVSIWNNIIQDHYMDRVITL